MYVVFNKINVTVLLSTYFWFQLPLHKDNFKLHYIKNWAVQRRISNYQNLCKLPKLQKSHPSNDQNSTTTCSSTISNSGNVTTSNTELNSTQSQTHNPHTANVSNVISCQQSSQNSPQPHSSSFESEYPCRNCQNAHTK